MIYEVLEVYTPHDTDLDRKRHKATFQSDTDDLFELAVQARASCLQVEVTEEILAKIRQHLECDEVRDYLEWYDKSFSYEVFGNNGDWEITVTQQAE